MKLRASISLLILLAVLAFAFTMTGCGSTGPSAWHCSITPKVKPDAKQILRVYGYEARCSREW